MRVCLIEDQHQFILHHKVPSQCEDEEVAANNLERRGLDRVRSHGADGFEHMVALSILTVNLHWLGWLCRVRNAPAFGLGKKHVCAQPEATTSPSAGPKSPSAGTGKDGSFRKTAHLSKKERIDAT